VRVKGAGTDAGAYEVLANAHGFGIDIPGCADASKNIREIHIDELNVDVREMTTGHDVEYRLYGPGHAHWGSASFTSAVTLGASKELQTWFNDAAHGKNIRKNITVTLFKSDKTPGRTYTLIDAFPIAWKDNANDTSSSVQTETITVTMDHIEFATRGADGSAGKPRDGFHVDILSPNDPVDVDNSWEIANGGVQSHEEHPLVIGFHLGPTLDARPHTTCTDLTLGGPMTDGRMGVVKWFNDLTSVRNVLLMLDHHGNHRGHRAYVYSDAFPVAYVFPHLSVTHTTGNVHEEVRIKPVRCELK
jgi:hypothetical protein